VTPALKRHLVAWRQLGPRRGTVAAARRAVAPLRGRARELRLRLRPLRAGPEEVQRALGHQDPRGLLVGRVAAALPTVAELGRRVNRDEALRRRVVELATPVVAHRFDLLGSGPTELGATIDWQRDFKSGRSWPLVHISRITINYPDGSDIKVPWELSRFQHLPVLGAAHRATLERRWLDELGAQLVDWIQHNPVEFGANWACTMDVAIRAANWVATLVLLGEQAADEPWFAAVLESLLLHGRFIRAHLEWAPVRGNHYLSDIVGLLIVAALFSHGPEGREWIDFATRELIAELRHQVRADGCDHEASIPYHRLVAELFICGIRAADVLCPGAVTASDRARLEAMLSFVADYTRPDGLAPQIGDADDGRLLPLEDYGHADPRCHLHLFRQAGRPYRAGTRHAAYPHGGYWVMRADEMFVIVRCGDVGLGGQGAHAHNDALAFELAYRTQPMVIDPGSFVYTASATERNRFRSTAFHSTLQIDRAEQNPISPQALFAMADRRRAEALAWEPDAERPSFTGCHHGYEALADPATHTRRLELDRAICALRITDTVRSDGSHRLDWAFPLSPCQVEVAPGRVLARYPSGVELELSARDLSFSVESGWFSPSYGRRLSTPFVRATKLSQRGEDVTEIILRAKR